MISVKNLSAKYDSTIAFRDVTFDVMPGDYLCILGENGSGKTTLMKTILGLQKPYAGSVTFDGIHQREIGYIPQQTVVQGDFPTSVFEVVLSGCQGSAGLRPFYSRAAKARARENLSRLGAEELADKPYRELSGGQRQRVLLARALCATEKILLLDEPAAGLDPIVSAELYGLLSGINSQGIAVMMVSHDVAGAVKYAGKILHLSTSPLFFGSAADYAKSEIGKKMLIQ
ncbi:MAG: metal ABC transporter ATP-binding protein [Oscillospiraceae bacterium]|nr:metal ABC transporter ATP-binding protein [Oscillospiraceae bacterium]